MAAAKAKTNDKRWINAINKAVAGVESWIVTELRDGIIVTTDSGEIYRVNGYCSCRAAEFGQPCKHPAPRRLLELYEAEPTRRRPRALSAPSNTTTAAPPSKLRAAWLGYLTDEKETNHDEQ